MAHMSSSSATDLARGSSENQASPASLFFLGLPLLRGIFCWGDGASTIFPPYASLSTSGSAWFDLIVSVGKGITPFASLGMPVAGENNSQSFWGLDLAILLLHAPFLMLWEVAMARPVCILHAVYPTNVQGGKFDQPGLAREIANRVRT
jgi:hypothetical protein